MIREHLKHITNELRFVLIYKLSQLILRLVPDNEEGNLWVIGMTEIAIRATEMRKSANQIDCI